MRIFAALLAVYRGVNFHKAFAVGISLTLPGSITAPAAPSFQQVGNTLVMSNVNVRVDYNLTAGSADFYWQNSKKLSVFYSGVTLSTGYLKGINYSSWSYAVSGSNQAIVTATGSGLPAMRQYFTLDQNDSFLVRVDMVGTNLSANWMSPVVVDSTGWVDLGITNDNRALVVPFDNDGFVRYNSMPINSSANGYEVGAFFDNTSRNGLVVGSVTHDTWKTGIFFVGAHNKLSLLNVFGGATAPADVLPHGSVAGNVISSPTIFVGFAADWRVAMQNYAAENTNFVPRLAWTNGVPFGWNSWGVIQQNISYTDAIAVSDYFYANLMNNNFTNNGTVYINLDSFWNNLSNSQLQSFVSHCHAHGQKTGIYFGPFVWFGAAANATNTFVEGTTNTYRYSDVLLRDGHGNFQSVDGGLAMDPTHPGTKDMINYYINLYTNWGFDYVKLDFLSHGALEGAHYDTNVTTGIEAYNQGMQYVLDQINGRMFISESISPLFPYQYGHSRRIACDAQTSRIGDTEYTMNSVSYGWWLDNLYQFNDPDLMVFANGADTNEAQSRLISDAVTGVFLDGDDLTTTNGQNGAQPFLTNAAMDNVARAGRTFTPVEGNTGSAAENIFVRQDGATWSIAVFNYTSGVTNETVNLGRAGLPAATYVVSNLWDGTTASVTGSLSVSLNAKQCKLFQMTAATPANLRWSAAGNSGVWDTGSSANWINLSNSLQVVFNAGDQVLFDDTAGMPTNVTVSGTVSPGAISVNSSTNDYAIGGSGTISGAGGLVKSGSSTLTVLSPGNFTGPVTICGGSVYAGNNCFNSVSSVTITNNSTFDFGGGTYNINQPITVSGTGVNGGGALYNSYDDCPGEVFAITLAGNTTFGGLNRWDLDGGSISGPYKVTINWNNSVDNYYGEWNTVAIATNVGDIELAAGKLGIKNMGATFGNPAANFIVDSGTELDFWTGDAGYARNFHVLTNGLFQILTGFAAFNGSFTLEDGAEFVGLYGSGNQSLNGPVVLNGVAHIILRDGNFIFTNVLSGAGGFVWDAYNHEMYLQASNTYSGPTIVSAGLTLGLTGNGSISHSSLVFLGGATLDVSGRADDTFALASRQTLGGIGAINGKLVVPPGATVSPAGTNVTLGIAEGSSSTGTITASNSVTLNGATLLKLNGSGVSDRLASGAGINYGGMLNLVNISDAPLAAGNRFQLFSAPGYAGSFASITPAIPGPGLTWDTSQLNNGILNVVAAPPQPVISSTAVSGGNLILIGMGGSTNGTYRVLTTTNVATPLTNWTVLATNSFNTNGTFQATNPISPSHPQEFYRIQMP